MRQGEGQDPRAREAADAWQRRFGREGHEGSYARHFHDDSYRSYRDRHLAELDRDYDEWCRHQEQAFASDFDGWRARRRQGEDPGGLEPGMAMTNAPGDGSMLAEDREADMLVSSAAEAPPKGRRRR